MSKWRDPAVRRKNKQRKRNTGRDCQTGKVRYRDQQEAIGALHTLQNITHRERMQTRAYECPLCHGFHLTSQERAA